MKRNRKLVRNSILIGIMFAFIYYFGGFFFSKEECVYDTIRALYGKETEIVYEFNHGNKYITIVTTPNEDTMSIVGTKRVGFLYQTASSSTGQIINKEKSIYITGMWSSDYGQALVVHRNLENISKVIVDLNDGNQIIFDEWNHNFAGEIVKNENWAQGIYRVYDENNQLIEEFEY